MLLKHTLRVLRCLREFLQQRPCSAQQDKHMSPACCSNVKYLALKQAVSNRHSNRQSSCPVVTTLVTMQIDYAHQACACVTGFLQCNGLSAGWLDAPLVPKPGTLARGHTFKLLRHSSIAAVSKASGWSKLYAVQPTQKGVEAADA